MQTLDYSSADVDIRLNEGDNESFDILNQQSGVAFDITGYTFTLFVYASEDPTTPLVQKDYTITSAVAGTASIILTDAEWLLITTNCCRYYVLETYLGVKKTLFGGKLTILKRGR